MVANDVLPVTPEVIKLVRAEFEKHPSGLVLGSYLHSRRTIDETLFTVMSELILRRKDYMRRHLFTGSLPECCRFALDYWKLKYVEGM